MQTQELLRQAEKIAAYVDGAKDITSDLISIPDPHTEAMVKALEEIIPLAKEYYYTMNRVSGICDTLPKVVEEIYRKIDAAQQALNDFNNKEQ